MDEYVFFFFFYFGLAFSIALVAILWGSHSKITGAGLILASVPISNVIIILYYIGQVELKYYPLGFALLDIILLSAFYLIYKLSARWQPNRWAAVVAIIHGIMASLNITGYAFPNLAAPSTYRLALNLLLILALSVCLIGFTPKNLDEAKGILKLKWMYFKNDIFNSWAHKHRTALRTSMSKLKEADDSKALNRRIGQKIRQARILRDLTQKELADQFGLSASQIQKFESGANRISASLLYAFANYLETDVGFFYEDVGGILQTGKAKT